MTEKNFRTIYKPFGPSIGQTLIPEDLINKINNYIDELIKDEERAKKQNVGKILAGNVTQEFDLDRQFSVKCGWAEFLSKECAIWIKQATGKKITKSPSVIILSLTQCIKVILSSVNIKKKQNGRLFLSNGDENGGNQNGGNQNGRLFPFSRLQQQ